jgi:hypothetical protein
LRPSYYWGNRMALALEVLRLTDVDTLLTAARLSPL